MAGEGRTDAKKMAPEVGIEPTTNRLTAGRSTAELLRNPKNCALTIFTLPRRSTRKPSLYGKKTMAPPKTPDALLELAGGAAIVRRDS